MKYFVQHLTKKMGDCSQKSRAGMKCGENLISFICSSNQANSSIFTLDKSKGECHSPL